VTLRQTRFKYTANRKLLTQSFIVPINAQYIHFQNIKVSTLKYITIAPICFDFD